MATRQTLLAILEARRARRPCWRCALVLTRHSSSLPAGGPPSSKTTDATPDKEPLRREPHDDAWKSHLPHASLESVLGSADGSSLPVRVFQGPRQVPHDAPPKKRKRHAKRRKARFLASKITPQVQWRIPVRTPLVVPEPRRIATDKPIMRFIPENRPSESGTQPLSQLPGSVRKSRGRKAVKKPRIRVMREGQPINLPTQSPTTHPQSQLPSSVHEPRIRVMREGQPIALPAHSPSKLIHLIRRFKAPIFNKFFPESERIPFLRPSSLGAARAWQSPVNRGRMSNHRLLSTSTKTSKGVERSFATVSQTLHNDAPIDAPVIGTDLDGLVKGKPQDIRAMLKLWQEQHKSALADTSVWPPSKTLGDQNLVTQSGEDDNFSTIVRNDEADDDDDVEFEADEPVPDIFAPQVFLRRGDLVEFHIGTDASLAVFVRNLADQSQFYTNRGEWVNRYSGAAQWAVSRFIDPDDLNEILPYLPAEEVGQEQMNRLHPIDVQAPRDAGANIIEQMTHFHQAADAVFREHAERINRLYEIIAPFGEPTDHKSMSLKDIAMKVLMKEDSSELTQPMMWAIHRAISVCQNIKWNRMSYRQNPLYEVYSQQGLKKIHQVRDWVREYQEDRTQKITNELIVGNDPTLKASTNSLNPIAMFVQKARYTIQRSRQTRPLSKTGFIGPSSIRGNVDEISHKPYKERRMETFNHNERIILHYLDAWAISSYVNTHTNLEYLGPMILRATGMYEGLELDKSRGFTFLQELGIVTPWENRTIYKQRGLSLPGHDDGFGKVSQMLKASLAEVPDFKPKDSMEGLRKDWSDMPVFCIDSAATVERDDGVSLELVDNDPSAYWVHIHVADPSAFIRPDSAMAGYAALIAESVYLPERKYPMLNPSVTRDLFSLANDRPCITFSAKVSADGDMLEKKVTPGIVRDVHFVTPQMVGQGLGLTKTEDESETVSIFSVGGRMPTPSDDDSDQTSITLTDPGHVKLLRKLLELGEAVRHKRAKAGAPDFYASARIATAYPVVYMSKGGGKSFAIEKKGVRQFEGDPIISIQRTTENYGLVAKMVSDLMVMAGDIAASWCAERNIPIPYRGIIRNPEPASSPDVFKREVLDPKAAKYGHVEQADLRRYMRLVGQAHASHRPLEHFSLGLPAYCKATSPLRRYVDLYAHWQIEAAIRHEAATGTSLVGSTDESYLPFSRAHVEDIAAGALHREQTVGIAKNASNLHWVCQALFRAFYFNEAKLPETFEVRAMYNKMPKGFGSGWSRLLHVKVWVELPPEVEREGEWKVGDVWEARLKKVLTYDLRIVMEPLRLIEREGV